MNVELSEACWVLIVARNQQGTGGKLRERPRYEQRVLQRGQGHMAIVTKLQKAVGSSPQHKATK